MALTSILGHNFCLRRREQLSDRAMLASSARSNSDESASHISWCSQPPAFHESLACLGTRETEGPAAESHTPSKSADADDISGLPPSWTGNEQIAMLLYPGAGQSFVVNRRRIVNLVTQAGQWFAVGRAALQRSRSARCQPIARLDNLTGDGNLSSATRR
jgi:hypothetical protein